MSKPLACILAAAILPAACTRAANVEGGRHPWTHAGVLRIAIGQEPKSLNPLLAGTTVDGFVNRLMFEPLISADPKGNPVPMLARQVPSLQNGGISPDGLTITYHLRENARWTDGTAVTSRDVKWTWQAILNPNNDIVSTNGYDDVRSIDTPDAHTVRVHLKARFAPFVNTFFAESDQPYDVVPAHVLAKYPNINHVPFNAAPTVSDGPFRFVRWDRGDRILLTANPAFFLGKPGLQRVQLSIVPDENSEINLLRTHAIDYIYQPTIDTYPAIATLRDVRIVWLNVNGYEGLLFNLSHPALASGIVRRAIAAAIDKSALVTQLTHGQATVATEDLPNWLWAFDPRVRSVPFDPAAAQRWLAQAGWIPGPDGIVRRQGMPMKLLLATDTQTQTHRQESLLIQAALRQIGIDVEVKYYPEDLLYAPAGMGGILHGGRFDLMLFPWFAGIDPDDSSQFMCKSMPPHGYDDSRYCNDEMDAAQEAALSHYDRATRKVAYSAIERLLSIDNPLIFFWWQRQQEPISVDFHGFDPNPSVESWNAWQWTI